MSNGKVYEPPPVQIPASNGVFGSTLGRVAEVPVRDPVKTSNLDISQWNVQPNGKYFPCGPTVDRLPPGNYWPMNSEIGPYLELRPMICDEIVELPDSVSLKVLDTMGRFWESEDSYRKFGLLFKRGILLTGPPGSGKSVCVRLLGRDIMRRGGIVIHGGSHPDLLNHVIKLVRDIEPDRRIIVVLEDLDEIVQNHGEHTILGLLDGELQVGNICFIATTNYPDRLGARIVNRPSRFDERIEIGMPGREARLHYLKHTATDDRIEQWADDTDGMSIAHLRELVAAVYCLGSPYAEVLDRLRSMTKRPETDWNDGFREKPPVGIIAPQRFNGR